MRRASIFFIAFACLPVFGPSADASPVKKFELGACAIPGLPEDARCGIYEVWENRAAKSGRKVPLQVVVLPATGPERLNDPLVYFAGGPGSSSINEGAWFASTAPELRKNRDVLLIDSRGTGQSAALVCEELQGAVSIQGFLDDYMPTDKVRACLDRLRKTADLTQYSTDNVVDDTEEIRTALGYGKVNAMGTSYGTRPVQVYMRRYPGSVRAAVMSGVLPMDEIFPLVTARYAQNSLEGLLAECEGDPACGKAFPKLREEVAAVLRQVEKEPVKLRVPDADTGQPLDFTLSKSGLGQVLRRMLYYNNWISLTPLYLHLAANGDWQPLAEFAQLISRAQGSSTGGYFLSITCSEDLAFVRKEEIPAAVAGTFLGDLRVSRQLAACEGWPAPKLGPEFRAPVVSNIPALLLSGGADPVTPASSGEQVARGLRRSRHIVVPDGGHGLDGMLGEECVPQMVSAFIAAGSAESLDTSCATRMRRPDFLLSYEPEVKLKPEELERLAGSWSAKEGLKVRTEVAGTVLRLVFPDESHLLAATSPTRFRPRNGETGRSLTFDLQDGRAVSMTLEHPERTVVLTPETATPASKLELKPCTTIPGLPEDARCGTYEVWENRAAKSGRRIPLRVVVIPATGPDRLPDPFIYFNGGPGDPAVPAAPWIAQDFAALRQRRDLLFVDFRGTSGPEGLFCPELEGNLQGFLDHYLPADPVKACAERLAKTLDLTQYTSDNSIDDVDEVRAALGYEKLNIYGGSGGTRAALVYARRHPDRVRTMALGAVVPLDDSWPLAVAHNAQRALDGLIAECGGDAACRAAFPRLREEVAAVLQRAEKDPVAVTLADTQTGGPAEIRLTRNAVAQTLRYMLYRPFGASMLPLTVHRAARGDWKPMAEAARFFGAPANAYARGFDLSLTCAEDVAYMREEEIPAAIQGTFLGDLRIRAMRAACASWPVPPVRPEFREPVTSGVPTLLFSGERDPVTPPANAEQAARTLKNSLQVVTPDGGHSDAGIEGAFECTNSLIIKLVETGTLKGLDTSCVQRTKRPEFVLKLDPDVELPAGQLARLAGTYKDPKSGFEVRIETVGRQLRVLEGEYPPTMLVAVSPTRFRMEGTPPSSFYEFQITDGRADALRIVNAGSPPQTLKREDTSTKASKVELKPCTTIPGLPPEARCSTYEVWENRAAKSGRRIPLRVVVIPATGPDRLPDALTLFAGGPGESNVGAAPEVLQIFGDLHKQRDILLVDFRGTGGSAGLFCPEMQGSTGAQGSLDHFLPPEQVRACAERLAKTADLSQYTNDTSVDDVDEVRAALGYEKLNIYGGSGGSRSVLVYLRRHPDRVRTAIVSGVVPPDERGPFAMARHAQRALDGLIAECEGDAACHAAFPSLRDDLAAVLRRTGEKPVTVTLTDGETGRPMEVRLTRAGVAQALRYMLYRPLSASILPLSLNLAARGDWKPLAEIAVHFAAGRDFGTIADGYYLSLTCSEDVPFIREDEIPAAIQGTFLGDFRIRAQQTACAAWPVPPVSREFLEPVTSGVPTLLLSGERDPVTPPISAERAARTLPNSLHVVTPDGGHGAAGIEGAYECINGLIARFVETGTVKGLDTSCSQRTKRPEFALKWAPEVELPADQLARLAGTYKDPESGYEVRIETAGRHLKLLEGEYPPAVLVAISPTRFRVEGMPPSFFYDFQVTDGRVAAVTVVVPGFPSQTLTREGGATAKLELKPCTTIPGLPPEARCGTYEVWENREAKSGRRIPLRVVVVPALGPDPLPDPFIYFEGGPGQSSVAAAPWMVEAFGALRKRRDFLLVDFRGTGGSGGLFCPELHESSGIQGFLDDFYPPERVKACAERLAKTADLSQYTNAASVDDVEEVRAALGYGKLNIYGASGGSKAALVYLRRHPEAVRTLVLLGVAPTDERGPFSMARNGQRALDGLIAECEGDADCRAAFPRLRDDVEAVLRQAGKEPVTVALTDSGTGKPVEIRLTRNAVAQMLRYMLYSPLAASLLPLEVHLAARGDWTPLAERALRFASRPAEVLSDGYWFSLTCSEDLPFIREDEIPAAVQGTFLGDFRIRKQREACAAWPVPPVGREFLDPVASGVPVLLLSGERDPVTPPGNAERAARTLENSLHVVVPDGGHSFAGVEGADECVDGLVVRLVETGSVKGLDPSCLARAKRPRFTLKRDPDVELPADQFARLAGTYKDPESGYALEIEIVGNRLRAVEVGEGSALVLVATSPTRFRIQGMTDTATFQFSEGKATAVLLEAPGKPSLTLKREGP